MGRHIDDVLLSELRTLMEDDFGVLLETYLEESARQFALASRAWDEGDSEALWRSAHSLKGGALNIGAFVLSDLFARLESAAYQASSAGGLLDQAGAELSAVQAEVDNIYRRL